MDDEVSGTRARVNGMVAGAVGCESVFRRTGRRLWKKSRGDCHPSLLHRFLLGTCWSLLAAIGSQGLTVVASVFSARMLGKEAFGQFGLLQGTVITGATFAGFGLGLTATRYIAYYRQQNALGRAAGFVHFVSTVSLIVSAMAVFVLELTTPWLATHIFHLPELATSIRWSAICLFCLTVGGVQTGVLAGFEDFRSIATVSISRGMSILILTPILVHFWNVTGAISAMAIGGSVACMVGYLKIASATKSDQLQCELGQLQSSCTRCGSVQKASSTEGERDTEGAGYKNSESDRSFDWSYARVLWTFSVPAVLSGVLVAPITWLASLWLARQPNGYAELGMFGAANQWRSAMVFLPAALSQPVLPLLTSLGTSKRTAFNHFMVLSAGMNGMVALGIGAMILLCMPVIAMLYGRSYAGLGDVVIPLLIAGAISCAAAPVGDALASDGRMWIGFLLNVFWSICLLGLAFRLVPSFGAKGLAYSFLGAYTLHLITSGACVISLRGRYEQ